MRKTTNPFVLAFVSADAAFTVFKTVFGMTNATDQRTTKTGDTRTVKTGDRRIIK